MFSIDRPFGHVIARTSCPFPELYQNETLASTMDQAFAMEAVKNRRRGHYFDIMLGPCDSVEELQQFAPHNLKCAKGLFDWIRAAVIEALPSFGLSGSNVVIDRSAMNRMYKDCEGRCHRHMGYNVPGLEKTPDIVGIFYVEAGSSLFIVDRGEHGLLLNDISSDNKSELITKTGDLLLHRPDAWHAIAKHTMDSPRTCFAFHISVID